MCFIFWVVVILKTSIVNLVAFYHAKSIQYKSKRYTMSVFGLLRKLCLDVGELCLIRKPRPAREREMERIASEELRSGATPAPYPCGGTRGQHGSERRERTENGWLDGTGDGR